MGDPVCWLDATCPDCGAFVGDRGRRPCPRCGLSAPRPRGTGGDGTRRNWAGSHTYHAPTLARPGSVEELQEVVAAADRAHALGSRHSFNDVSDCDGVQVSLAALPPVVEVDATTGTAWTAASGRHGSVTVSVLGNREPRQSAALRDDILNALADGRLSTVGALDRSAGVVLVGGGPGDPELVTVAARQALAAADVVVTDRLAPRELLAELAPHVELIDVTKLPRGRAAPQEEINRILVDRAGAGQRVVRFKGGDSFVFGRGYEEVLACREAGVPVTVIPGLPSPIGVPAVAGIPITHRGVSHGFTVISGHLPPGHADSLVDWEAAAGLRNTLVLMMAVQHAPEIARTLVEHGRGATTPVAVICDGTMPTERTVLATLGTLEDRLAAESVRPPAIIVVGEVVAVAHPTMFGTP